MADTLRDKALRQQQKKSSSSRFFSELSSFPISDIPTSSDIERNVNIWRLRFAEMAKKYNWNWISTSAPGEKLPIRTYPLERRISAPRESILEKNIIARQEKIWGRALGPERMERFATVIQGHEFAEMYAAERRGFAGPEAIGKQFPPRFGSHFSQYPVAAEMEIAASFGSQTLEDVIRYREVESRELLKTRGKEFGVRRYAKEMAPFLQTQRRKLSLLRQSEYASRMSALSDPRRGELFIPEFFGPSIENPFPPQEGPGSALSTQSIIEENKALTRNPSLKRTLSGRSPISKTPIATLFKESVDWIKPKIPSAKQLAPLALPLGMIAYWNLFSGRDDEYNTIEGLNHKGLAWQQRKILTDFGSGYDIVRGFAKQAGKTFETFISQKGFQESLSQAQQIRILGEGSFGTAALYKAQYLGQEFSFVKKQLKANVFETIARSKDPAFYMQGTKFLEEASVYKQLGETPSIPSLYKSTSEAIYMEHMPGEMIGEWSWKNPTSILPKQAKEQLFETVEMAAQKGIKHLDIHAGNILFDPVSNRASIIDWGLIEKTSGSDWRKLAIEMEEKIFSVRGTAFPFRDVPEEFSLDKSTKSFNSSGLTHKGIASAKRSMSTDFGSPWKGLFGGISRKISQWMGKGVKEGAGFLLDPRKAAKMAQGASLEQFAKSLGQKVVIAKDEAGEAIYSQFVKKAPGMAGGAAYVTTASGEQMIMMSPQRLKETFQQEAVRRGMTAQAAQEAVSSEDFLKTVLYHEVLEKQASARFSQLRRMPAHHEASQVLIGEGGFIQQTQNSKLQELFSKIRKGRVEEHHAFSFGFEAFSEKGIAPKYRHMLSDFGSGYRIKQVTIPSKVISQSLAQSTKAVQESHLVAQDLKLAKKAIWDKSTSGARRHQRKGHRNVEQISRYAITYK